MPDINPLDEYDHLIEEKNPLDDYDHLVDPLQKKSPGETGSGGSPLESASLSSLPLAGNNTPFGIEEVEVNDKIIPLSPDSSKAKPAKKYQKNVDTLDRLQLYNDSLAANNERFNQAMNVYKQAEATNDTHTLSAILPEIDDASKKSTHFKEQIEKTTSQLKEENPNSLGANLYEGLKTAAGTLLRAPSAINDAAIIAFKDAMGLPKDADLTHFKETISALSPAFSLSDQLGKVGSAMLKDSERSSEKRTTGIKYQGSSWDALKNGEIKLAGEYASKAFINSLPSSLTFINPVSAVATGVGMVGNEIDQAEGGANTGTVIAGTIKAGLEFATERMFGAGKAARELATRFGNQAAKSMVEEATQELVKRSLGRKIAQTAGEEFVGEAVNQIGSNAADIYINGKNISIADGVGDAAIIGLFGGITQGGATIAATHYIDKNAIKKAQEKRDSATKIIEESANVQNEAVRETLVAQAAKEKKEADEIIERQNIIAASASPEKIAEVEAINKQIDEIAAELPNIKDEGVMDVLQKKAEELSKKRDALLPALEKEGLEEKVVDEFAAVTAANEEIKTELKSQTDETTIKQFEQRTPEQITKSEPAVAGIEGKGENAEGLSEEELRIGIAEADNFIVSNTPESSTPKPDQAATGNATDSDNKTQLENNLISLPDETTKGSGVKTTTGKSAEEKPVSAETTDGAGDDGKLNAQSESEKREVKFRESPKDFVAEHKDQFDLPEETQTRSNIRAEAERAKKIAEAYDKLPDDDSANPEVKEAYGQLGKEVQAQYDYITKKLGLTVEFTEGDFYNGSQDMVDDVMNNGHLKVFRGGEDHPLLGSRTADENGVTLNEKFRAVHDFFAHALEGNQFGVHGEERAWLAHSKMFSEKAQHALTTETRGQNSWVNFSGANKAAKEKFNQAHQLIIDGRVEEGNKLLEDAKKEFVYAKQKVGLLPKEHADWRVHRQKAVDELLTDREKELSLLNERGKASNNKDGEGAVRGQVGGLDGERASAKVGHGASSRYDVRGSDRVVQDGSVIQKISTPDAEVSALKDKLPDAVFDDSFSEINSAEQFNSFLSNAKSPETGNKYAASVFEYSPEKLKGARFFVTNDGKAGAALTKDGTIISVFSYGEGKGRATQLILHAIKEGGTSLDHYDTRLTDIYSRYGFVPVARMKWDDSLAPKDWDKEVFKKYNKGEPDVIAMAYHGGDPNTLYQRVGRFANVNEYLDHTPYVEDWTEAKKLQKEYVAQVKKSGEENQAGQTQRAYQQIAGMEPNSPAGRIPVAPIIGVKTKQLSEIIFNVTKGIRQRLFFGRPDGRRRGTLGTYSPGTTAVKIRFNGDLDVTAHELGHSIDDQFGILSDLAKNPNEAVQNELLKFSDYGSKPPAKHPNPKMYIYGEGFAEWLRAFVVNPDAAIKAAPKLYDLYTSKVSPEFQKALEQFSAEVRTWAGSTGRDMVLSNVQWKPEEKKGVMAQIFAKSDPSNMFAITWADRLAANFFNPLRAFAKANEYIKGLKHIDEQLPANDPILLARTLLGVNGKVSEILNTGMIDSKMNVLTDADGKPKNLQWLLEPLDNTDQKSVERDTQDVVAFMVAQRTLELSERLGKGTVSGIGGGIFKDVDVAQKTLDEISADPERLSRITEAAHRYREMADDVLKYMVDKGRLSKDNYDAIKKDNAQYVAMQRVLEAEPGREIESHTGAGGNLGNKTEVIKAIKGSSKTIKNPYVSLLDLIYKGVKESDRNESLLAFRNLLVPERTDMYDGATVRLADIGARAKSADRETVVIFVDGKPEYWKFQSDIYKALKGLDSDGYKLPAVMTALPRALRWTVTHFPVFAARNVIRDFQSRIILSNENNWKNAYGIKDLAGAKEHWHEVARAGGLNAGYYMKDKHHYYGLLEEAMHDIAKNKKFVLLDGIRFKEGWEAYTNLLQKSETVNRVAEFRAAFRKAKSDGMDDYNARLYAGLKSREQLDFALMGHWMQVFNQLVPFSNAAVQGLRSGAVKAKENPLGFTARMIAFSVIPSMALWFVNHKDEETGKEYEELPDYQRDLFYNFKIGDNKWVSIPKPYELSLLGSGVDRGLSKAAGKKNAFDGYAGDVAKTTLPFDESSFAGGYQSIIEGITNYDFFRNKAIVPPYEDPLALALRNTENASRLGQGLQKVAGIDARKIDHFIQGQFSYYGKTAMEASNIGRDGKLNPFPLPDLGFFKQSPAYNSKSVQKFLQLTKEYQFSSEAKEFSDFAKHYFDAKTDKEKEDIGKRLIQYTEREIPYLEKMAELKEKKKMAQQKR